MFKFLMDEHLRGRTYEIMQRFNEAAGWPLDITVVGEFDAPSLGTSDSDNLAWAETERCTLLTADKRIGAHVQRHLENGQHVSGVIILTNPPTSGDIRSIFEFLRLIDGASEPSEWLDRIEFFSAGRLYS